MQLNALLFNFILYFILLLPPILFIVNKKVLSSKKELAFILALSFIIDAVISFIIYNFGCHIFALFTNEVGLINLSIYISKIIFLDSSLYGLKVIIPAYLMKQNKKVAIFFLLKITTNLIILILGYSFLEFTMFLYLFPICDIVYYCILIKKLIISR